MQENLWGRVYEKSRFHIKKKVSYLYGVPMPGSATGFILLDYKVC